MVMKHERSFDQNSFCPPPGERKKYRVVYFRNRENRDLIPNGLVLSWISD